MNGNNFESMIKKYTDELLKMSKEKILPDITEAKEEITDEEVAEEKEGELLPFEEESTSADDIPGTETTDFYEENTPEKESVLTDYATFSARVFTGNNAYPIENAKVLVVKDDTLYTFLITDRNGTTKKVRLPSFPERNSLNPESNERAVQYTGEVYATGFTPKKNLFISAVGGSDIVLDIQMTPISERVR